MTAAARVTDDLEFAYPGTAEIGHEGEFGLWPVNAEGRNVAWYRENNFGSSKSYHVVGEYNDFMGGYYQKSEFGFGHWALYDEMPGHKLWLWSLARDGGIWGRSSYRFRWTVYGIPGRPDVQSVRRNFLLLKLPYHRQRLTRGLQTGGMKYGFL